MEVRTREMYDRDVTLEQLPDRGWVLFLRARMLPNGVIYQLNELLGGFDKVRDVDAVGS